MYYKENMPIYSGFFSAPMISVFVKKLDYFWTLVVGNLFIGSALYLMSWIPSDLENVATLILIA